MKALTLQRPWAAAFLLPTDPKRIENRKWKPPPKLIGQRIALHSGLGWWPAWEYCERLLTSDVERVSWRQNHEMTGVFATAFVAGFVSGPLDYLFEDVRGRTDEVLSSRWWIGTYAWILTNFVALPEPIQCTGHQGLWNLPADVLEKIGGAK